MEAMEAVEAKLREHQVDRIYCLGDIVGYGPNPIEMIEYAQKNFCNCVLGNHDEAVIKEPRYFNRIPKQAVMWTKSILAGKAFEGHLEYLRSLEPLHREGDLVFSHGMYDNNMNYVESSEDLLHIFEQMSDEERVCFGGHSHQPSLWVLEENDLYVVDLSEGEEYHPSDNVLKIWVNVGSVGQPRDRDPRASFVLYDTEKQEFRFMRVAYDHEKTADKIRKIKELDDFLADRLSAGI